MSRHRADTPLLTPSTALPSTAVLPSAALMGWLGHTAFERMCGIVLAFPGTANRLLSERNVPDPVLRYTLLAETALRLNKARDAVVIARRAVHLAAQEEPVDPGRLLPAATVLADATVVAGAPDAVTSCTDLAILASRYGDESRATIASGLHAVATFHQQSCRQAIGLLDVVGRSRPGGEVEAAVELALDAVANSCSRRGEVHWAPTANPVISSGGLVQVALSRQFWADRLERWPGIHDCTTTTSARPIA